MNVSQFVTNVLASDDGPVSSVLDLEKLALLFAIYRIKYPQ